MDLVDVLIVGAGPTGLVLALWLARLGVRVRLVDKLPEPATASRAVPFYRQLGIAGCGIERRRRATSIAWRSTAFASNAGWSSSRSKKRASRSSLRDDERARLVWTIRERDATRAEEYSCEDINPLPGHV